jgi:GT2 family glycosyltransferase
MSLAIILLNWRNAQETLRCVHSISAWAELRPQFYVVDNESTPATSATLGSALSPDSLICSPLNLGYAGGNNLGIRRALEHECEYILLLNSDAEIAEAAVQRLLATLKGNPQIAILGPLIKETCDGRALLLAGGRDIARYRFTRNAVQPQELGSLPDFPLHEVDYVSGTVFMTRATLFKEVGLLDEEYFFSGEIADFCKRARDKGHRIYVDLQAEARHDPGQASPELRQTLYTYYSWRNRFLYVRKRCAQEKMKFISRWTTLGVLAIGRALCRGEMAKARAIALALRHAHAGRYGNQNASFLRRGGSQK